MVLLSACHAKDPGHIPEYYSPGFWDSHDIAIVKVVKSEPLNDGFQLQFECEQVYSAQLAIKQIVVLSTRNIILFQQAQEPEEGLKLVGGEHCILSITRNKDEFTYVEILSTQKERDSLSRSLSSILKLRTEKLSPTAISNVLSKPPEVIALHYLLLRLIEKDSPLSAENLDFLEKMRADNAFAIRLRILASQYVSISRNADIQSHCDWIMKAIQSSDDKSAVYLLQMELIAKCSRETAFNFLSSYFSNGKVSGENKAITAVILARDPQYNFNSKSDIISQKIRGLLIEASRQPNIKYRLDICISLSQIAWNTIQISEDKEFSQTTKELVMEAVAAAMKIEVNNDIKEDIKSELDQIKNFQR